MSQCKHTKKRFEVSFVSSGMEKGRTFSVFCPDKYRLKQIQYRAGKLIAGTLHYTRMTKPNSELGLEELSDCAKFLGLTVFHKIHLNLTRPV